MKHFCIDIETLGKGTNSIILSAGIVHFELDETVTFGELITRSRLVKFDVKEQYKMGRKMNKLTLEWWGTQPPEAKRVSLNPSPTDLTVAEGLDVIDEYVKEHGEKENMVWSRGTLDQLLLGSLYDHLERKAPLNYNQYMDIRTFNRLMKESTNSAGYTTIPDFDEKQVIKHNPVHDIALDVMGILYGD